MDQPWSRARVLSELLEIMTDLVDALRQPLVLASIALLVVLLVARFAIASH